MANRMVGFRSDEEIRQERHVISAERDKLKKKVDAGDSNIALHAANVAKLAKEEGKIEALDWVMRENGVTHL